MIKLGTVLKPLKFAYIYIYYCNFRKSNVENSNKRNVAEVLATRRIYIICNNKLFNSSIFYLITELFTLADFI